MLRWFRPYLGGKDLVHVNRELLDQVRAKRAKGVTPATVNRYMALVRAILRRACFDWEWMHRVPKVGMMRDQAGRVRALTRDLVRAAARRASGASTRHGAILSCHRVAPGERHAAPVEADQPEAAAPNGGPAQERESARGPAERAGDGGARQAAGRSPDARLHVRGNPITQVNTKAWRNALKRAGVEDFRWHDLRHTFATWHREAGTPTHELQRLGGWKTQSMVERYARVAPEGLQMAASRLDSLLGSRGVAERNCELRRGKHAENRNA